MLKENLNSRKGANHLFGIKTAVSTFSTSPSKSGQAVIELLPSVLLFMIVMTAGLSYFRMMREAVIRQEVVRSLAFAKIDSAGTLTSTLNQYQNNNSILLEGIPGQAIPANRNDSVRQDSSCFVVSPEQIRKEMLATPVVGLGNIRPLTITTYAVMYRTPAGRCP